MLDSFKIISSILISIIAGITEFLPISSTGHMIIISHYLNIDNNNTQILEIFIQLGSTLATLYFFYNDIIQIIQLKINYLNKKNKNIHFIISILPTIFIGLIFYKTIKSFFNSNHVMYGLILGSFFLLICEIFKPKKYKTYKLSDINITQAIIIGCVQIFCLYPGFSRSGATIGTGIILGMKKSIAIKFSFLISIPLSIGASIFDLINNFDKIIISEIPIFFVSLIISFIVSLIFIKKLLKIINQISLIYFAIYRLILASLIYFYL